MYCTYHDLCQKFRAILLLTFDFPRHPKYTDKEHWKCCYLSQLSQNWRIAATWKWHEVSVPLHCQKNNESWSVSKLSMSANTEYISCTSGKYYHETHTNDVLKAQISNPYFEKLSLFPASKFLCCCWYIPCRYISQIRRLSSVQSSFRSIVWYVSSYSSTLPRWDRFSRCDSGRVELGIFFRWIWPER